jgi:hypothetical protein
MTPYFSLHTAIPLAITLPKRKPCGALMADGLFALFGQTTMILGGLNQSTFASREAQVCPLRKDIVLKIGHHVATWADRVLLRAPA